MAMWEVKARLIESNGEEVTVTIGNLRYAGAVARAFKESSEWDDVRLFKEEAVEVEV